MTDKDELKRRLATSSKKVLIVGDIHLRDKAPRNASDTYLDDILDILRFTAQLEKAFELDAVVWAGDVFDHKQPFKTSHRLVLRAIEVVKAYRRLLIVTGNHDISNDRLETVLEQQPLGVLLEAGAEELAGWDSELPIFGLPWQQNWFDEGVVNSSLWEWREAASSPGADLEHSLVVTHAPIMPPGAYESSKFEVLHPSDFAAAMGNKGSLYYGHIHDDHGIYEVNGVQFANVGAISRGSLTESNLERKIQAALWTPEHGFLAIDLPHKPGAEVLNVDAGTKNKLEQLDTDQFLSDVGSTRLDISSTAGVIEHIAGLADIEKPVKDVAIELLELQDA